VSSVARRRRQPRPRARRGEGLRLRDEILDATERLMVDRGDADAVSVRDVADAVGVTPPSIYLHFADKSDLVFAVCERNFARLDEEMETAASGASDPVEALLRRGRAYVRFGLEHPEQYRILFMNPPSASPPRSQDPQIVGGDAFAHLVDAVKRCVDVGALGGDPLLASFTIWSAVHGLTSLLIAKPAFPWPSIDAFVEHVVHTQIDGLSRADEWPHVAALRPTSSKSRSPRR
jgi:AcrR family transcriptional regulator